MNDSDDLIISIFRSDCAAYSQAKYSNEIYLSNSEVEAPRRTLTLYYYRRARSHYIFSHMQSYTMCYSQNGVYEGTHYTKR